MVFYQLHIFNRSGKCLYALECNKRKSRAHKPEQDQKLLFGMLHSLKNFLNQVNPCQCVHGCPLSLLRPTHHSAFSNNCIPPFL